MIDSIENIARAEREGKKASYVLGLGVPRR